MFHRSCLLMVPITFALVGCASPLRPGRTAEEIAAMAAGLSNAMMFRSSEDPIDTEVAAGDPSLPLTAAVRLALASDPAVQAALARVRIAQAEAQQARLLPNPILTIVFRFPETGGPPIIEASLAAELLSILQLPGRVSAADNRLRAAGAEAVTTVLDALTDVQQAYAEAQSLEALMPILEERKKLTARLIEIAESRLRAGEGTRLDLTTLQSQQVELEVEIAERQSQRRVARVRLARLVGSPRNEASWRLEPWTAPAAPDLTHEPDWIIAALEHRPEVQSRVWELKALGVEAKLARWALFEESKAGANSEKDTAWSVGPALTTPIPLLDWGQAKRARAQARRVEAMHELTRVRREVVEQVRAGIETYRSSAAVLEQVRRELLPLVERRRREAESAYRAGQTDVVVLILADQDLQANRAKLIELQQMTSQAFFRLERSIGGPGYITAEGLPRQDKRRAEKPINTDQPRTQE